MTTTLDPQARVQQLLDDLRTDGDLRAAVQQDPAAVLRDRGIDLPEGTSLPVDDAGDRELTDDEVAGVTGGGFWDAFESICYSLMGKQRPMNSGGPYYTPSDGDDDMHGPHDELCWDEDTHHSWC